jgi:SagB-type dehydrogenase family enzyme
MQKKIACVLVFVLALYLGALAQESMGLLPKPDTTGGKPLMESLKLRRSSRSFSDRKLPPQVLSNLLWAAFGINRPDGHRTAPSARNWQEIDIYVTTVDGVSLYDPAMHALKPVLAGDVRAKTGMQDFVSIAPLNLVYVADLKKTNAAASDDVLLYIGADCGFIAQNVYLYCASEGLSVVVRGMVDRQELAKVLHLRPEQRILLAQTIGFPK